MDADARVALCVYDITSMNSFRVLKDWVEELKHKGPKNIGNRMLLLSNGSGWK